MPTKNAGTGKTLTGQRAIPSIDGNSGNNYTVSTVADTTGVINARALTITAITNTKTYDATTSAAATPTITGGALQGGDSVAGLIEAYADQERRSRQDAHGHAAIPSLTTANGGNELHRHAPSPTPPESSTNARALTITASVEHQDLRRNHKAAGYRPPTISGLQLPVTATPRPDAKPTAATTREQARRSPSRRLYRLGRQLAATTTLSTPLSPTPPASHQRPRQFDHHRHDEHQDLRRNGHSRGGHPPPYQRRLQRRRHRHRAHRGVLRQERGDRQDLVRRRRRRSATATAAATTPSTTVTATTGKVIDNATRSDHHRRVQHHKTYDGTVTTPPPSPTISGGSCSRRRQCRRTLTESVRRARTLGTGKTLSANGYTS